MARFLPEFEYDESDTQQRLDFFSEMYQAVASFDIPTPPAADSDVHSGIAPDEWWPENTIYHAQLTLMDALANVVDVLAVKLGGEELDEELMDIEDDEGFVFDDEA